MKSLRDLLAAYTLSHDLAPTSRQQLRLTIDRYERWLGRAGTVLDLEDDSCNRWLQSMQDSGLSRTTVRGQRANLLTLWRWACEECGHDVWPRRVRKIRAPVPIPEAWSECQMRSLLTEAAKQHGRFKRSRVRRADYWRALILVAWDSALRLGDLLRLRFDQVGDDGCVVLQQSKTGWPIVCRLRPETVAAVQVIRLPPRDRVFGDGLSRGHLFREFRLIVKAAGLVGGTKRIRRGAATAVERLMPGSAQRQLGHRTPGLAARHYIDPRLLGGDGRPRPPKIG